MFLSRVGSPNRQGARVAPAGHSQLREGFLNLAAVLDVAGGTGTASTRGGLVRRLYQNPDLDLRSAFQTLPTSQQQTIRQNLGNSTLHEILSLAEESDPQILASDSFHLARRLEGSSSSLHQRLALQLYLGLGNLDSPVGREAQAQAEVLSGRGTWGRRLEYYGDHFFQQVADPAMLGGLVAASAMARLTYAGIFSRLAPAGRAMSWGRLWATRGTAGLFSLGVEAPTWVMAENGLRTALGERVDWSYQNLQRQGLSALVLMGMLRLSGVMGRSLSGAPLEGAKTFNQMLMPHATMLGGVYTAFGLEEVLGLRQNNGNSHRLFDSLTFLIQAQVAGTLSHALMGPRWTRFQRQLDFLIQNVEVPRMPIPEEFFPSLTGEALRPAFAGMPGGGNLRPRGFSDADPSRMNILLSEALSSNGDGEPLPPEVIAGRLDQMIRPKFGHGNFVENSPPENNGRHEIQKIGILTSGGDGPGENAVIEALVKGAVDVYGWKVIGIWDGFRGLLEPEGRMRELDWADVHGPGAVARARNRLYGNFQPPRHREQQNRIQFLGGNLLRSSRTNPVETDGDGRVHADRVFDALRTHGVDALVVVGGNGSQRAAKELADLGVPLVFIPQTIDADVPGSAVSLGFPSAVNRGALEIPEFLNTAQSCNRWFLVEVMGQHYGLLTLGIARSAMQGTNGYYRDGWDQPPVKVGGVFTELPRSLSEIPDIIRRNQASDRKHGVILVAEGVEFREGRPGREEDSQGRLLIEAGDVTRWLRKKLIESPYGLTNTRSVSLGYSLRGARPVRGDLFLAKYFANGALGLIDGGNFGRMVGADFLEGSAKMSFVYPRLADVIHDPVRLREDYFEFMRNETEQ